MAPLKSVKDNDDFPNRRMTRAAFKQASGSPENDPQQKKLGFSKQKQEGLYLSKKPRLSKTHDEQQEQQQQHRDGKDVKDVRRKTLTGEDLRERHKVFESWRLLTPEEAEIYSKKVTESEGFDVVDLPYNIDSYGLIRPVKQSNEEDRILEECAKSAIVTFNKEHKTEYRFVKVIKANYHPASGIYYYITFEAEHKDVGSKNFQAFVRFFLQTPTVEFCRIEEPPKEWVKSNFKYTMIEEDPNKPKKPSPAIFWFLEDFRKTFREMYPNASDSDVGQASARKWASMSGAKKAPYEKIAEEKMVEYCKNREAYKKGLAEDRLRKKNLTS
ncbi:hypothetical protein RHSIM_Rhsim12G0199400 [Rhododendron simsii]|uniref:HMG box domain-containing protein n=1 Tax=Rhododendron simsii TaxID=118357 RepID=A0A834G3N7_RHOSS|nr:hypothetical protein RHSIM_Rhsim12G0199400 [Rhododendron simsii]